MKMQTDWLCSGFNGCPSAFKSPCVGVSSASSAHLHHPAQLETASGVRRRQCVDVVSQLLELPRALGQGWRSILISDVLKRSCWRPLGSKGSACLSLDSPFYVHMLGDWMFKKSPSSCSCLRLNLFTDLELLRNLHFPAKSTAWLEPKL